MIQNKFKEKLESMARGVICQKSMGYDHETQERLNQTDIFIYCKGDEDCMRECQDYYNAHKIKTEKLLR